MNKIYAVDAVIVPSAEIQKLAKNISQAMWSTSPFIFDDTHIPHLTLAMGYIEDVDAATTALKNALKTVGKLTITIHSIGHSETTFEEYHFNFFDVEKTEKLIQLNQLLMETLPFVEVPKETESAFFHEKPDENIAPAVFEWVHSFKDKSSFEKYWPHITLPAGDKEQLVHHPIVFPLTFTVDALHLFQLGNYCTCRKLLGSTK
jgi:2'-5' RNA ligase